MKTRLLSVFLSILLLTSFFTPAINAEPVGFVTTAPEVCEIVVYGVTVVVSGAFITEIGKNLGKTWDGIAENWNKFLSDVQNGLNDLMHAGQWIKVTSQEGKAIMTAVYELNAAGGSSGGKKNDKWYFEARLNSNTEIEINPKLMTREQAVKEMERGKDIITVSKKLARKVVGQYKDIPEKRVGFEIPHKTREGYYEHAHYYAGEKRLHCWVWRP